MAKNQDEDREKKGFCILPYIEGHFVRDHCEAKLRIFVGNNKKDSCIFFELDVWTAKGLSAGMREFFKVVLNVGEDNSGLVVLSAGEENVAKLGYHFVMSWPPVKGRVEMRDVMTIDELRYLACDAFCEMNGLTAAVAEDQAAAPPLEDNPFAEEDGRLAEPPDLPAASLSREDEDRDCDSP